MLVPTHPLALLAWSLHMVIRNVIGHSGYELFPRNWVRHRWLGWITAVTHHDLHHQDARWNLGLYFTWWDKLMGTEHPDYIARFDSAAGQAPKATEFGTSTARPDDFLHAKEP